MPALHAFANPARFLKLARPLTPVVTWLGVALIALGCWAGLTQTPPDYLQGETVRMLADVAARAIAVPGAAFSLICLVTGAIWGRPTWGTYWQWDGRLTSMLLLFFVYLGYIALARADRERGGDGRIPALFGIAGTVLLPIIRYSVVWWNTLHQGPSIGLTSSSIDPSLIWPLPIMLAGFTLLFAGIVLMRMRAILAQAKAEARMRRRAAQ